MKSPKLLHISLLVLISFSLMTSLGCKKKKTSSNGVPITTGGGGLIPIPPVPVDLTGTWEGTNSQSEAVTVIVENDQIKQIVFRATIPSCFTATYTITPSGSLPINSNQFSYDGGTVKMTGNWTGGGTQLSGEIMISDSFCFLDVDLTYAAFKTSSDTTISFAQSNLKSELSVKKIEEK